MVVTLIGDSNPILNYFLTLCYLFLNSYAVHRLAKIRSLRWVEGTVLPEHITREILSPRENDYFTNYNVLIAEYNDAIKSGTSLELDLSSELQVGCVS